MESDFWVRYCANCRLCKYTRGCKKRSILYHIARMVQKICPICYMANRTLRKNFQDSNVF